MVTPAALRLWEPLLQHQPDSGASNATCIHAVVGSLTLPLPGPALLRHEGNPQRAGVGNMSESGPRRASQIHFHTPPDSTKAISQAGSLSCRGGERSINAIMLSLRRKGKAATPPSVAALGPLLPTVVNRVTRCAQMPKKGFS